MQWCTLAAREHAAAAPCSACQFRRLAQMPRHPRMCQLIVCLRARSADLMAAKVSARRDSAGACGGGIGARERVRRATAGPGDGVRSVKSGKGAADSHRVAARSVDDARGVCANRAALANTSCKCGVRQPAAEECRRPAVRAIRSVFGLPPLGGAPSPHVSAALAPGHALCASLESADYRRPSTEHWQWHERVSLCASIGCACRRSRRVRGQAAGRISCVRFEATRATKTT